MQKMRCPHCRKKLKYQEGLEGGTYKCPRCGRGVRIVGPTDVGREMERIGASLTRALMWSAIGVVVLGSAYAVYYLVHEQVKQHHRDTHRILVR